jgi:DNA-binding HxlR family transcriptional regulator
MPPYIKPIETKAGGIASAMQVIGSKWTALIVRDLVSGPKRFGELERLVAGINPRTLSQRLDDLEGHGILARTISEAAHATYQLTKKGQDLVPILQQMATWGDKYYDSAPDHE